MTPVELLIFAMREEIDRLEREIPSIAFTGDWSTLKAKQEVKAMLERVVAKFDSTAPR